VAYFELALTKLGLPGSEVLFIDDQDRFRRVAKKLGIHFILAQSPEQIVKDTKALLRTENGIEL
jgi:FMN phosphatase YigB (HAD superfamily)